MIKIDREDFDKLRNSGLIKFKTGSSSPNFYICNKQHKGKSKTYYVVEEYKILRCLGLLKNDKKSFKRKQG